MQENVAYQASPIHAGGKIKPTLGKLKEHTLALRAVRRVSRLHALYRSCSVVVAWKHRRGTQSALSVNNADLADWFQRKKGDNAAAAVIARGAPATVAITENGS